MRKIAQIQAQANAIAKGEDAAMNTVETVLLLIATVAVVAVVFVFLTTKLKTGTDGIETDVSNANSYAGGNISAKA